jgi:hypothetical protein
VNALWCCPVSIKAVFLVLLAMENLLEISLEFPARKLKYPVAAANPEYPVLIEGFNDLLNESEPWIFV